VVLGAGDVIVEAVLVQVSAKVAVDKWEQCIALGSVLTVDHHTEAHQVVDAAEVVHGGLAGARHAAQFGPGLPVAVDDQVDPAVDAG